jgi:FtsP/CotA-like multicopper oxidase with cupredoxin domain
MDCARPRIYLGGETSIGCLALAAGLTSAACSSSPPPETIEQNTQASVSTPQNLLVAANIPQFVTPLTTLSRSRVNGTYPINVDMEEFQQDVLPSQLYPRSGVFARGTFLWGYDVGGRGPSWPGATIEAQRGVATAVNYTNGLRGPNGSAPFLQRFLSVDLTVHWADPIKQSAMNHCVQGDENGADFFTPDGGAATNDAGVIGGQQPAVPPACQGPATGPIPTVPHLHGHEVPSAFDGHPDAWFTPGAGITGAGFVSTAYEYPNAQEATTLWFHDHALGMVRLNVYSGLAAFYFIRDGRDTGLSNNPIKLPAGDYEQEILVADRLFDTNGQLLFPDGSASANGNVNGLEGAPANPNLHPFAIPEFFGNVITVNGKSWPYLRVEPRRYRFRFLNGSNARFYQMQLFEEAKTASGKFSGIATLFTDTSNPPVGIPGPPIWQIGSDGGFLDAPVNVDLATPGVPATGDPNIAHLFMAPAERSDVVVDFGGQAGKRFVLTNIAVTPYPGGGVVSESVLPSPAQQGPTTANPNLPGPYETTTQVMEFRVDLPLAGTDRSFNPASSHPPLRAAPIVDIKPAALAAPDAHRQIILDEVEDTGTGSPVEVIINNSHWNGVREGSTKVIPGSLSNKHGLFATETPRVGATELWEVANLTPDAHPLHIHLVQFQIIDFQPFFSESDLCPFGAGPTGPFGPDGNFRFDFSGPEYRQAYDALFPGGTFNGFTFEAGNFIPGFGPPGSYFTPNADHALGGNLAFGTGNNQYFVSVPGSSSVAVAPQPRDGGWKDTAKMFPCGVTRLAVRWAPQDQAAGSTHPGQNDFPFDPTSGGPGYVWHCHILDHEDNEMMRPILLTH